MPGIEPSQKEGADGSVVRQPLDDQWVSPHAFSTVSLTYLAGATSAIVHRGTPDRQCLLIWGGQLGIGTGTV